MNDEPEIPRRPPPEAPEPPPVPAAHPAGRHRVREALRIPASFYAELFVGLLALVAVAAMVSSASRPYATVITLVGGAVVLVACVVRLVKRVNEVRKKGKSPAEAVAVFWACILVPAVAISWYVKRQVDGEDPRKVRQAEALYVLSEAYRSERAFRTDFGHFTYNAKELGMNPRPGARYALAFPPACTMKFSVEGAKPSWDLRGMGFSSARRLEAESYLRGAKDAPSCRDPQEGFELYAIGELRDGAPLDVWRIDERGKLENVQRGY